ncbi:hypothetical protein QL285_097140 [Trifolium repens]|nr:hypothetical protein QL285_097140 [Trifolium repens]
MIENFVFRVCSALWERTKRLHLHLLSLDLLSVAAQSPIRRPPLSLSHIRRTFPPTTALTLSYPPHLCSVNLKPYHLSASRLLQRPLLSIFSGSQDCKRSDKDTHYMSSGEIQDQ